MKDLLEKGGVKLRLGDKLAINIPNDNILNLDNFI